MTIDQVLAGRQVVDHADDLARGEHARVGVAPDQTGLEHHRGARFNAVADQAPDIAKLAEPRRLRHPWINGLKDLPVTYA